MAKARVLLIGWDAADWKIIQPLLDGGQMPHLARLIANGVRGNVATIYPVLSPMLWTSIATGKRAYKHGIHGFSEPLPDGSGVRPITLLSRKTKALWNILNQTGHRSVVVGWWPSHPAEPLNGVMVSDYFQQPTGMPGAMPPLPPGTVHPAALVNSMAELRVNPMELTGEFLRLFVPDYEKVDQEKDKRLHSLAKIISETMSIHAAATELLETEEWDFAAIYYSGIDHFGHGFMRYHPPRLSWVTEEDFAMYQHVIANAYRYHDAMLGTLLRCADENTTVILLSDHGFHPDHMRPGYIPAEPAGPAVEHRHYGILCMKGPALRAGEQVFGAGILDICPTILTLFGLPPGKDMDGKVLSTAFKEAPCVEPIASWDDLPGQAGTHSVETQLDPTASAQAFKQLVQLGYVAPPGGTIQQNVDECIRELKYNLARAYRDANLCGEAATLADELWIRWPKEHRFGILLIDCLGTLRQLSRRRASIEELGRRLDRYQAEAISELARCKEKPQDDVNDVQAGGAGFQARQQYEERSLRELSFGRPLLVEWFLLTQALLEQRPSEARPLLAKFTSAEGMISEMSPRVAGALAQLGDMEGARSLLETALEFDPENAFVLAQLAGIHLKTGRLEHAIAAATESLSLLYFQPAIHGLLGRALMEAGRFLDAEKELLVAIAQSPRNLAAHECLGQLYRDQLNRPNEAFAHEGRARSLRNELALREHNSQTSLHSTAELRASTPRSQPAQSPSKDEVEVPAPFGSEVNDANVITVVSGLPRSGTSMMMQLIIAGGRLPLTDGKRDADEDNPLGYFELEKTLALSKDSSWLPEARGKVVKIVAQLLPFLPRGEHYNVVFMERNLGEVIASQNAMLVRQGRPVGELAEEQLMQTYAAQLQRVRDQLSGRADIRILTMDYARLLSDPVSGVDRVARFLGRPFDRDRAVQAVRPELQRQKPNLLQKQTK
jgi:predicted AlkP superfamily phosphohydrolase/phosphomutase/tetratricopeptide (TPR) repeat protein